MRTILEDLMEKTEIIRSIIGLDPKKKGNIYENGEMQKDILSE